VGFAASLLRLLIAFAPGGTPRLEEVHLDGAALMFAVAAAAACGILFGAFPAAHGSGVGAERALIRIRGAGASARTNGLRRVLLVVEVALALVLLTGAGLMVRTLAGLTGIDAGFRADGLLTGHLSLRGGEWTDARRGAFIDTLIARVRALPGVTSASVSSALAIDGADWNSVFITADKPVPARRDQLPGAAFTPISAAYFDTMGTPVLRGRAFIDADRAGSPSVIVNESLARTMWPGEDPIGKRIKQGWPEQPSPWREVVGVVRDVKFEGVAERTPMQVYLPIHRDVPPDFFVEARTAGDPSSVAGALTAAVHAIDRNLPLYDVRPMTAVMAASIAQHRMAEIVLGLFAAVALLLAAIGLYGLVAHSVNERTHEIGVRMALGANRGDVLGLIVRGALVMALAGILIGLAGASAVAGALRGLLFSVEPLDPLTFSSVALVLLATSILACLIPAWRAVRISPTTALRET
jgi:putative ABC transport system permease protein